MATSWSRGFSSMNYDTIPLEYKYIGEDYQMNTRKIDPS